MYHSADDWQGLFSAPAHEDIVAIDTPYDLAWDPSLLKYFVNGEGASLGYEEVSQQILLYLVDLDYNSGVGARPPLCQRCVQEKLPSAGYMPTVSCLTSGFRVVGLT